MRVTGRVNPSAKKGQLQGTSIVYRVEGVDFSYGAHTVLRDLTVSIERGAFYSVIGPNGSGKTTTLSLLSGHLSPAVGSIVFDGRPLRVYSVRELAQKVSFVRQGTDIRFPFTCLELVMMGRSPFGNWTGRVLREDLEIAYRAMRDTDTVGFAARPVTALSAGERQRVILARALAQTPRALFLDEAFSDMDVFYMVKLLELLKNLVRREGLTVISVTHDLNMAYAFSDFIIAMDKGRIVKIGPPADVVNSQFIRTLLGVEVARTAGNGIAVLPRLPSAARRSAESIEERMDEHVKEAVVLRGNVAPVGGGSASGVFSPRCHNPCEEPREEGGRKD